MLKQLACGLALLTVLSASAKEATFTLKWEAKTAPHLPQAMLCSETGEYLFTALKTGGVSVFDVRGGKSTRIIANIPTSKLAGMDAMNLALQGDRLYVALGDFFAPANHAGLATLVWPANRRRITTWC